MKQSRDVGVKPTREDRDRKRKGRQNWRAEKKMPSQKFISKQNRSHAHALIYYTHHPVTLYTTNES